MDFNNHIIESNLWQVRLRIRLWVFQLKNWIGRKFWCFMTGVFGAKSKKIILHYGYLCSTLRFLFCFRYCRFCHVALYSTDSVSILLIINYEMYDILNMIIKELFIGNRISNINSTENLLWLIANIFTYASKVNSTARTVKTKQSVLWSLPVRELG